MNQVYVVCEQTDMLLQIRSVAGNPVAAFSDYPSALAYAKSIFANKIPLMIQNRDPRDLIFLIPLTTSPSTPTTPTAPITPTVTT